MDADHTESTIAPKQLATGVWLEGDATLRVGAVVDTSCDLSILDQTPHDLMRCAGTGVGRFFDVILNSPGQATIGQWLIVTVCGVVAIAAFGFLLSVLFEILAPAFPMREPPAGADPQARPDRSYRAYYCMSLICLFVATFASLEASSRDRLGEVAPSALGLVAVGVIAFFAGRGRAARSRP